MAGVGEPPVEDNPTETGRPTALLDLLAFAWSVGSTVVPPAAKKLKSWIQGRREPDCPERGKAVKKSWDFCPRCGKKMPRPPAVHP